MQFTEKGLLEYNKEWKVKEKFRNLENLQLYNYSCTIILICINIIAEILNILDSDTEVHVGYN